MISNNKVKKILLVDDELDITFTIKNMLYNTGFQIFTFNDPITPLKFYRRNFYDLIINWYQDPKYGQIWIIY